MDQSVPADVAARVHELEVTNARLAMLADITNAVTTTLDTREALQRLARLIVPRLADWCVVDLCAGPHWVERVTVVHRDADRAPAGKYEKLLPQLDERSTAPLARVLSGAPAMLLRNLPEPTASDDAVLEAQLSLFAELGADTAIIAPLRGRGGTVLGAITVVQSDPGRPFTADDVPFVEDVARRAAISVDNALAYTAQRDIAESLQRSLLPALPKMSGITFAARYYPARGAAEVGGDWYDAFPLPDGKISLIIGDVTGHDLAAAVRMGELRNMLRTLACDRQEPPGHILKRLDQLIAYMYPTHNATAVYALLHQPGTPGSHLTWSNAGHPPPLLVMPDGTTHYLESDPEPFLGIAPNRDRESHAHEMPPGVTLLLFTDGLVESRGRSLDSGLALLEHHAAQHADAPLELLVDAVTDGLVESTDDDIAILAVRAR